MIFNFYSWPGWKLRLFALFVALFVPFYYVYKCLTEKEHREALVREYKIIGEILKHSKKGLESI